MQVCQAAGRKVQETHPHIQIWTCMAHALNLLLGACGKLPLAASCLDRVLESVKYIKGRNKLNQLFLSKQHCAAHEKLSLSLL